MSTINEAALQAVVEETVEPMVLRHLGSEGATCLVALWRTVKHVYRVIAPERYRGRIHVAIAVNNDLLVAAPRPTTFSVLDGAISGLRDEDFVLQILHTGEYALWRGLKIEPSSMADRDAMLYEFASGVEHLFVKTEKKRIANPYTGIGSGFAPQTFVELQIALEHYGAELARFSSCKILKAIWEDDERLYLIAHPEKEKKVEVQMRQSLTQHLKSSLRSAEVRPEQNVDESKPVDIKVTWTSTRRHAVIEIKWLGKSVDESGKVTAEYADWYARKGAVQLVGYLDSDHEYASNFITCGYLVVFDARRPGLASKNKVRGPSPPAGTDLGTYRTQEIEFDPEYDKLRPDFHSPVRYFLEPA